MGTRGEVEAEMVCNNQLHIQCKSLSICYYLQTNKHPVTEWHELREQQDREYEESLMVDKAKDQAKEDKLKRNEVALQPIPSSLQCLVTQLISHILAAADFF